MGEGEEPDSFIVHLPFLLIFIVSSLSIGNGWDSVMAALFG